MADTAGFGGVISAGTIPAAASANPAQRMGPLIVNAGLSMMGSYKQSGSDQAAARMHEQRARQIEKQNTYMEWAARDRAASFTEQAKTHQRRAGQFKLEAKINQIVAQANEMIEKLNGLYAKKRGAQKALAIARDADRAGGRETVLAAAGNVTADGPLLERLTEIANDAALRITDEMLKASREGEDIDTQAFLAQMEGLQGAAASHGAAANQYAAARGAHMSAHQTMAMLPYERSASKFEAWKSRSQAGLASQQANTRLAAGFGNAFLGLGNAFLKYGHRS